MKRTVLLLFWLVNVLSFAQLKVDSIGHVGIGTTTTPSLLSIGGGNSDYMAFINESSYKKGLGINNMYSTGLNINNYYQYYNTTTGISIQPAGGGCATPTFGLLAYTGSSSFSNYSICGLLTCASTVPRSAAIYGSSVPSLFYDYTGIYAAYFNGDVRTTGTTFTSVLNCNYVRGRFVEEESLSGESLVSESISRLNPIRQIDNREEQKMKVPEDFKQHMQESGYEIDDEVSPVQVPQSKVRYALEYETLKEIFPELVYEDEDGNVSINYIDMIPLLVQSVKELKSQISELQGAKSGAKSINMSTDINQNKAVEILTLSQNVPNPFTTSTTISVTVPRKTKNAAIFVYDMSGKQLKEIEISTRGKTNISISSEGLAAGMYMYSLIADGKVISTKKMILTK